MICTGLVVECVLVGFVLLVTGAESSQSRHKVGVGSSMLLATPCLRIYNADFFIFIVLAWTWPIWHFGMPRKPLRHGWQPGGLVRHVLPLLGHCLQPTWFLALSAHPLKAALHPSGHLTILSPILPPVSSFDLVSLGCVLNRSRCPIKLGVLGLWRFEGVRPVLLLPFVHPCCPSIHLHHPRRSRHRDGSSRPMHPLP